MRHPSPKYQLKLDLSLKLTWIYDKEKVLIGFWFPYNGRRKDIYGSTEFLQQLKKLLGARVLYDGSTMELTYKFQAKISEGQFGKVNKFTSGSKTYAIKTIDQKNTVKQKQGIDSLLNEITIMQSSNHHNIVKLYEVYQDDKAFYLVMEYLGGITLRQVLQNSKSGIPDSTALKYVRQLLEAVCYIHQRGIIHRDIKPSNIMLQNDRLVLIDFGLSCEAGEQNVILPDCGTIGYMAPEVLSGTKASYDQKADIFSIGCVYYRLFTGQSLFPGKNSAETQRLNKTCDYNLDLLISKGIPFYYIEIIKYMLHQNPQDRLSAEEALKMIDAGNKNFKENLKKIRGRSSSIEKIEKMLKPSRNSERNLRSLQSPQSVKDFDYFIQSNQAVTNQANKLSNSQLLQIQTEAKQQNINTKSQLKNPQKEKNFVNLPRKSLQEEYTQKLNQQFDNPLQQQSINLNSCEQIESNRNFKSQLERKSTQLPQIPNLTISSFKPPVQTKRK